MYAPFDTPAAASGPGLLPLGAPSVAAPGVLDSFPLAADTIASALGLRDVPNWEAEAATLKRDEVARRLGAAGIGGLTEAIWSGLVQVRERARSITPVLGEGAPPPRDQTTPSMARTPRVTATEGATYAERFPPFSPLMAGRVPRSQETWQPYEGECEPFGCFRAVRMPRPLRHQARTHTRARARAIAASPLARLAQPLLARAAHLTRRAFSWLCTFLL